jgi:hypothetical protein
VNPLPLCAYFAQDCSELRRTSAFWCPEAMSRFPFASVLVFAALLHAAHAADAPANSRPADETNSAASPAGARERPVSAATAERLATVAPRFAAPESTAAPAPEVVEPDKPRNTIVRLPRYIVDEPKVRVPQDYAVLTERGRLDLAFRRHPGLNFGPLSILNAPIGLAMVEEEQRLDRLAKIAELSVFLGFSGTPLNGDVRRLIQQSFVRSDGWILAGGSFQHSR